MNGVCATCVVEVYNAPVLVVDDAVLASQNKRSNFGVTGAKRQDNLLVAHHPLVGHQEVIEPVGLGSARLDFKLGGKESIQIPEASGTVGENRREFVGFCGDNVAKRDGTALVHVISDCRKTLFKDV